MGDEINIRAGHFLDEQRGAIAAAVTDAHYAANPELERRYGARGREKCLQDAGYHLAYLSEALTSAVPAFFADYVVWARWMLESRGVPASDLVANLGVLRATLDECVPEDLRKLYREYIELGIDSLARAASAYPSYLVPDAELGELARSYVNALLRGERHVASRLVLDAVASGVSVRSIYLNVFQCAQHEIGRLWQLNKLSVAQEHYCTAATQLIMSQLYDRIFSTVRNGRVMVATCVAENMHEIGARMVADFFEMEGWDTYYLGANAPTASIVQTIVDRRADLLAVSATMTWHVRSVASLIHAVRDAEQCRGVAVLVGGYPFNAAEGLWREIGADGFAANAEEALRVADELLGGAQR
jgi:MerR family transcriptional regulator, light-induced transcriptional regulator